MAVGHADNIYKSSIGTNGAEIALVYKNGKYYAFLNGTLACQFNATFDNGWGGTVDTASKIGTEGTLKVGLSIAFGTAQFSDWGYSTDAEEIAKYVADPEVPNVVSKPALESKLYTSKKLEVTETQAEMLADEAGAYFFKDVEIAQDENFVIYATLKAGFTSDNIGFVVGTLEETKNHLLFQWRANDIYIWRNAGGWTGHADNIYKPGFGTNANDITMALVYKDGNYHMFLNGVEVFSTGATFDNGWGGTVNVENIIGTTGTKKIGLSQFAGESIYSDWGYSTDAEEVAKYFQ